MGSGVHGDQHPPAQCAPHRLNGVGAGVCSAGIGPWGRQVPKNTATTAPIRASSAGRRPKCGGLARRQVRRPSMPRPAAQTPRKAMNNRGTRAPGRGKPPDDTPLGGPAPTRKPQARTAGQGFVHVYRHRPPTGLPHTPALRRPRVVLRSGRTVAPAFPLSLGPSGRPVVRLVPRQVARPAVRWPT